MKAKLALGSLMVATALPAAGTGGFSAGAQATAPQHLHISCYDSAGICAELGNAAEVFGADHYVGHDEPGVHFFSDQPGSGNRFQSR
jgi:hypothetical protein